MAEISGAQGMNAKVIEAGTDETAGFGPQGESVVGPPICPDNTIKTGGR